MGKLKEVKTLNVNREALNGIDIVSNVAVILNDLSRLGGKSRNLDVFKILDLLFQHLRKVGFKL